MTWCEGYGDEHEYFLFNTQEETAYINFLKGRQLLLS